MKRRAVIVAVIFVGVFGLACEGEGGDGKGYPVEQNASCHDPGTVAYKKGVKYVCTQTSKYRARWKRAS